MLGSDSGDDSQPFRQFDVGDRSPALAIVESVACVTNRDSLDLFPLASRIDAEALEQLVASTDDVSIRFEYEGVEIKVDGSGTITILNRTL